MSYILCNILGTSNALTNLILTATIWHKQYDYDEEIEAWKS